MNGNPSRQMLVLAIVVAVVIVGFVIFRFAPGSAAPAASPAPSGSQALQAEPEPTDNNDEQSFHGVQCNPDCSEVISGYNDAQGNGVKSRSDCADEGSVQHQQGCWAYADEQQSGGQNSSGQNSGDQNSGDQNGSSP